jgi:hypothetical protein
MQHLEPVPIPAPPPKPHFHLDAPERRLWDQIHRTYTFNYGGEIILALAMQSLGRARACDAVVAKEGMQVRAGRRCAMKAHPLLAVSQSARNFAAMLFRRLRIDLGRFEFDCKLQ